MSKSADAFRTISEVADWLGVQAHVLRFWESKFTQIKPVKRAGGRRYYRPADMLLLGGIRKLLHQDGLSIKEVQTILRDMGVAHVSEMSHDLDAESPEAAPAVEPAKKAQPIAEAAPLPSTASSEQADSRPASSGDDDIAIADTPTEQTPPLADQAPEVSPVSESAEFPPQEPAVAQPAATQGATAEDVTPDAPQEVAPPAPAPSEPDLSASMQDAPAADSPAAEAPSVTTSPAQPDLQADLLPEAPEQDAPPASALPPATTAPSAAAPSGEDGEEPQQMFMELDTPDAGTGVQGVTTPQPEATALSDFENAAENSLDQESRVNTAAVSSIEGSDQPEPPAASPDLMAGAETEEESESPWGNAPDTEPSGAEPPLEEVDISAASAQPPLDLAPDADPLVETDAATAPAAVLEVEATETMASADEILPEDADIAADESPSPKPRVIDIPDEASVDTGLAAAGVLALLARTTILPPEVTKEVAHHAAELRAFLATR